MQASKHGGILQLFKLPIIIYERLKAEFRLDFALFLLFLSVSLTLSLCVSACLSPRQTVFLSCTMLVAPGEEGILPPTISSHSRILVHPMAQFLPFLFHHFWATQRRLTRALQAHLCCAVRSLSRLPRDCRRYNTGFQSLTKYLLLVVRSPSFPLRRNFRLASDSFVLPYLSRKPFNVEIM